MTAVKILQKLLQLFRYADVEKYTGNANVFLTRALKNGLVERIARGVYINAFLKNQPEIEDVACFLRTPSYISCEWALNRNGILLQHSTTATCSRQQSIRAIYGHDVIATSFSSCSNDSRKPRRALVIPRQATNDFHSRKPSSPPSATERHARQ